MTHRNTLQMVLGNLIQVHQVYKWGWWVRVRQAGIRQESTESHGCMMMHNIWLLQPVILRSSVAALFTNMMMILAWQPTLSPVNDYQCSTKVESDLYTDKSPCKPACRGGSLKLGWPLEQRMSVMCMHAAWHSSITEWVETCAPAFGALKFAS